MNAKEVSRILACKRHLFETQRSEKPFPAIKFTCVNCGMTLDLTPAPDLELSKRVLVTLMRQPDLKKTVRGRPGGGISFSFRR